MSSRRKDLELESLAQDRLVDLVSALVYPLADWRALRRLADGRNRMADVVAREAVDASAFRDWWIRVLRTDDATGEALHLLRCVQELSERRRPHVLLLVSRVDISAADADAIEAATRQAGIERTRLWDKSALARLLDVSRPDLRFAFFGVSSVRRIRVRSRWAKRKLAVKRRLVKAMVIPAKERPPSVAQPYEKFRFSRLIVRSVDDDSYPAVGEGLRGSEGWLKVGTYDFYHDGVEVIVGEVDILLATSGRWRPMVAGERFDATRFRRVRAFEVGRIPFGNIIEVDVEGDEYHRAPHLYCVFAHGGLPYEDIRFYSVAEPFRTRLDAELLDEDLGRSADEHAVSTAGR